MGKGLKMGKITNSKQYWYSLLRQRCEGVAEGQTATRAERSASPGA
jgi:hypothetical protein